MNQHTEEKWVAVWGNAISITERKPAYYAKDVTLRYPIMPLLSGNALRITLDNFTGTEDVTITRVFAGTAGEEPEQTAEGTSVPVTFRGETSVVIPAGGRVTSDPVSFSVIRGQSFSISLYLGEFTLMRAGVFASGPLSRGFFSAGDYAGAAELPWDMTKTTQCFYFLSDVDVLTTEECRSIICYGDSITAQSWPDYLTRRLLDSDIKNTAVIRRAASGTRVLRQYDNITYDSYGLKGSIRFPREARAAGADTILIQQGINDIIHPVGTEVNRFRPWSDLPEAEELIDGLRSYITQAREYGLKVYLGTLLPIEGWRTYADFREELRCQVNEWMRTTKEADGCVDFDRVLCDPAHPAAFAPGFDSGDHLHPSEAAYRQMAACIPEEILVQAADSQVKAPGASMTFFSLKE